MSPSQVDRNPVEVLAEEFVERHRQGERPALTEYTDKYPEFADEIRELFPALVMMEDLKPVSGDLTGVGSVPTVAAVGKKLERLGDYRILREVGRGGMGIVYEAEQESLGRHVALKVLPSQALLDPRHLSRFQREARAAARLHHTNIVPVYGVGHDDGLHYYVMQFIQGQGLDEVLNELRRLRQIRMDRNPSSARNRLAVRKPQAAAVANALLSGTHVFSKDDSSGEPKLESDSNKTILSTNHRMDGPDAASLTAQHPSSDSGQERRADSSAVRLPGQSAATPPSDTGRFFWQSIARIGVQVAEALAYANSQGTLHRDIKPSNLLLDTQGTVWVTDFGLAKAATESDISQTGDIVGTLRYMAPERFNGKGDIRSDIYSLGLTLYELAAMEAAFPEPDRNKLVHQVIHEEPPPPRKHNPEIPRDLETIILKAISRDPARRYATGKEFAEDLRNFIDDKPIKARRITIRERFVRWRRRNPALAASLAACLILFFVGFGLVAWKWREESKARAEADIARKDAEDKAEEIRAGVDKLKKANALVERSRIHAHYQRWAEAEKALTQAVELRPDNSLIWWERARLYQMLGLGDLALADSAKAWELQEPATAVAWYQDALLRLYQGDVEGYRRRCQEMTAQFGTEVDPVIATESARTAALSWEGTNHPHLLVQEAEKGRPLAAGSHRGWHLYVLGLAHYRAGNYLQAAQKARESIRSAPGVSIGMPYFLQAMALAKQGKDKEDDARRAFEQGQQFLNPFLAGGLQGTLNVSPTVWFEYLEMLVLHREAKYVLDGAPPDFDARLVVRRARALAALERFDQAEEEFAKAVEINPTDPYIHLAAYRFFAERNDWKQADESLEKAAALKPEDTNIRMEAFRILAEKGDWDRAAEQVDKAVAAIANQYSMQAIAIRQLLRTEAFRTLAQKGQWEKAVSQLEKSAEGGGDESTILIESVNFLISRGEIEKAQQEYQRIRELRPKNDMLILRGAQTFYYQRQYEFAAREFSEYLKRHPKATGLGSNAWYMQADCHFRLGQWDPAIEAFTLIVDNQPQAWPAYQQRGDVYAEKGDWDKALADFEKAVALAEPFGGVSLMRMRTHLALAYLAAGRNDDFEKIGRAILEHGGKEERIDRGALIQAVHALALSSDFLKTQSALSNTTRFMMKLLGGAREGENSTRGRINYRLGLPGLGVRPLENAVKANPQGDPADPLFLAMAYHQSNKKEDAKRVYDQAVKQIAKFGPPGKSTPVENQKRWHERLSYEMLRKEAEALLKGP